ncbi:hypothetical protein [Mesorhizobium sp. M1374]|uniref:hypothetical protein n=1 Tax=Mesorhizobium sp. M1374 TaxID=2957091 RepID=UPI00333CD60C
MDTRLNPVFPHYFMVWNQETRDARRCGGTMEISVWDDPDAFVEEFNSSPEAVRREHSKATRRRGGLQAVCERSSLAVFGMGLRDLDREARKTLPPRNQLEAAHAAIRVVAGYDPDHAVLDNNLGFARSDVALGHALASAPSSAAVGSPGMALLVWRMAMRYRRQVPPRLNLITGFTDQADLFDRTLHRRIRRLGMI